MNERSLYTRLSKELSCPAAIAALEIGTMAGRFVKPRDGWGMNAQNKMVRIPNPVDYHWTTDCLELKAVKARTMKGMVFRPAKAIGENQWLEMEKHNALIAIAFILDGKDSNDQLVAIYVMRFWKIERSPEGHDGPIPRIRLEEMSNYTIKGPAYGKVPGEEIK